MDVTSLKGLILNGREIMISLGGIISKFIPQFAADKIAGLIVLVISFWIISTAFELIPTTKSKLLYKLIGTGALFYFLWLW